MLPVRLETSAQGTDRGFVLAEVSSVTAPCRSRIRWSKSSHAGAHLLSEPVTLETLRPI